MQQINYCFLLVVIFLSSHSFAQEDTVALNQDAIYNRPFINLGQSRTAVGGYIEGNTNYFSEDGVTEGFSMELRRFNVFLYAPIGQRIRFLSELEFEHGTEEIALETALMDFEINQGLSFRAGIILPQIGIFNANHDSPNWEFVERPLSSTSLIPSTLSEVGFGVYGKLYPSEQVVFSYDVYLTNGLQDGVILNDQGRTHLASGKSEEMFAEDNNGIPMINARISCAQRKLGEFGFSYYGGIYNTFRMEGEVVDDKRMLSIVAFDFNTNIKKLTVKGEVVAVKVDVPDDIEEIYGENQHGAFVDLIYPILKKPILKFEKSVLSLAVRGEYADYNDANFKTNIQSNIKDDVFGFAIGLSLRPLPGTMIRANYRRYFINDILGNPTINLAGFQFGIASYF